MKHFDTKLREDVSKVSIEILNWKIKNDVLYDNDDETINLPLKSDGKFIFSKT